MIKRIQESIINNLYNLNNNYKVNFLMEQIINLALNFYHMQKITLINKKVMHLILEKQLFLEMLNKLMKILLIKKNKTLINKSLKISF